VKDAARMVLAEVVVAALVVIGKARLLLLSGAGGFSLSSPLSSSLMRFFDFVAAGR
jgi:hypothetical protein